MAASNFLDVGNFHQKFDLDNVIYGEPGPRDLPDNDLVFRIAFMKEELKEFVQAAYNDPSQPDHAGMFDALLDLVYVAMGTAHLLGYPWQEGWEKVQEANMAKVRALPDGSDSKRNSPLDVVKPEGWTAPDIAAVLARYGF